MVISFRSGIHYMLVEGNSNEKDNRPTAHSLFVLVKEQVYCTGPTLFFTRSSGGPVTSGDPGARTLSTHTTKMIVTPLNTSLCFNSMF